MNMRDNKSDRNSDDIMGQWEGKNRHGAEDSTEEGNNKTNRSRDVDESTNSSEGGAY